MFPYQRLSSKNSVVEVWRSKGHTCLFWCHTLQWCSWGLYLWLPLPRRSCYCGWWHQIVSVPYLEGRDLSTVVSLCRMHTLYSHIPYKAKLFNVQACVKYALWSVHLHVLPLSSNHIDDLVMGHYSMTIYRVGKRVRLGPFKRPWTSRVLRFTFTLNAEINGEVHWNTYCLS